MDFKIYKLTEVVMPHQTLLQHQLGYVCGLPFNMKTSSHKT